MNVLILGSGGREHAFAWKIKQSKGLGSLYIAPGNPGTAEAGMNLSFQPEDFGQVRNAILDHRIDMVVVGPEAPLVAGVSDFIHAQPDLSQVMVIGPGKMGALLEGSKDFAKEFMFRHRIPTAAYLSIGEGETEKGLDFLRKLKPPYVLKADGLAAGKGVLIINDFDEAVRELNAMLGGKFGEASKKVVIEEYLSGIELSVFVLTDGTSYVILPEAKDYKRIGEGDTGLNTGGMGAVSPVPFADDLFMEKVGRKIIQPTVEGLKKDGIPYCGFIFIGLMNVGGEPFVIEYNVRMGDPETEAVLPRIDEDFLELLIGAGKKKLENRKAKTDPRYATTTVLVSGGYPGSYTKGLEIQNLPSKDDCLVFHAGTGLIGGNLVTNGGRVLALTTLGTSVEEALSHCRKSAESVKYEGKYFRGDIGKDLIPYL